MLIDYLPVLIHVIVAVGFGVVALGSNLLLCRVGKRNKIKDTAYECGIIPEAGPQPRFSVKFYLVAMLFILFDIEVVFMYPWAVVFREYIAAHGAIILWSMMSFVVLLLIGYVYAVKKGALEWRN
ncbi:MAG: NADH-quinone oxidoreductase subunit A [Chthoniobacterales bacterium]